MIGFCLLAVAPVFLGNLEPLVLNLGTLLEALELLLVANLQPELDDNAASVPDVVFEVVDFSVGTQPVRLAAESLDPLDEYATKPGAVENDHSPEPRHVTPESPEVRLCTLLFGGRSDRDDLVLPRIHGRHYPANGAALAGCIRTFESKNQGPLLEVRVAHQFGQAPLPGRKLGLVDLFCQALRHVERTQHVQTVDPGRERRGHRRVLVAFVGQTLLERLEDRLANGQRAITIVGSLDDDPRRPGRIGGTQQVASNLLHLVVGFQAIPTRLGHPPPG